MQIGATLKTEELFGQTVSSDQLFKPAETVSTEALFGKPELPTPPGRMGPPAPPQPFRAQEVGTGLREAQSPAGWAPPTAVSTLPDIAKMEKPPEGWEAPSQLLRTLEGGLATVADGLMRGLTLGNVDLKAVEKFAKESYERRGAPMDPKLQQFLGTFSTMIGGVVPITLAGAAAGPLAAAATKIPVMQSLARSLVAGTILGVNTKPQDGEGLGKRLAQIPGSVAMWGAFDLGLTTANQAWKILQWNRTFGKGQGAGTKFEPFERRFQDGSGAGSYTKEFTPQQMRDLYNKMNGNASGAQNVPFTTEEKAVIDELTNSSAWKEWILKSKKGGAKIRVETTGSGERIVEGYTATPFEIPNKPKMSDLFRDLEAMPQGRPSWEAGEFEVKTGERVEGTPGATKVKIEYGPEAARPSASAPPPPPPPGAGPGPRAQAPGSQPGVGGTAQQPGSQGPGYPPTGDRGPAVPGTGMPRFGAGRPQARPEPPTAAGTRPEAGSPQPPPVPPQPPRPQSVTVEATPNKDGSWRYEFKLPEPKPPAAKAPRFKSYDEAQRAIDEAEDAKLPAPEIEALYAERDAIGQQEFEAFHKHIRTNVDPITGDGGISDTILRDVYDIDPSSATGQARAAANTGPLAGDPQKAAPKIARIILEGEIRQRFGPSVDVDAVMNGKVSGLTEDGIRSLRDGAGNKAKKIAVFMREYFGDAASPDTHGGLYPEAEPTPAPGPQPPPARAKKNIPPVGRLAKMPLIRKLIKLGGINRADLMAHPEAGEFQEVLEANPKGLFRTKGGMSLREALLKSEGSVDESQDIEGLYTALNDEVQGIPHYDKKDRRTQVFMEAEAERDYQKGIDVEVDRYFDEMADRVRQRHLEDLTEDDIKNGQKRMAEQDATGDPRYSRSEVRESRSGLFQEDELPTARQPITSWKTPAQAKARAQELALKGFNTEYGPATDGGFFVRVVGQAAGQGFVRAAGQPKAGPVLTQTEGDPGAGQGKLGLSRIAGEEERIRSLLSKPSGLVSEETANKARAERLASNIEFYEKAVDQYKAEGNDEKAGEAAVILTRLRRKAAEAAARVEVKSEIPSTPRQAVLLRDGRVLVGPDTHAQIVRDARAGGETNETLTGMKLGTLVGQGFVGPSGDRVASPRIQVVNPELRAAIRNKNTGKMIVGINHARAIVDSQIPDDDIDNWETGFLDRMGKFMPSDAVARGARRADQIDRSRIGESPKSESRIDVHPTTVIVHGRKLIRLQNDPPLERGVVEVLTAKGKALVEGFDKIADMWNGLLESVGLPPINTKISLSPTAYGFIRLGTNTATKEELYKGTGPGPDSYMGISFFTMSDALLKVLGGLENIPPNKARARALTHTLVHEYTHGRVPGHDVDSAAYNSALTENYMKLGHENLAEIERALERLIAANQGAFDEISDAVQIYGLRPSTQVPPGNMGVPKSAISGQGLPERGREAGAREGDEALRPAGQREAASPDQEPGAAPSDREVAESRIRPKDELTGDLFKGEDIEALEKDAKAIKEDQAAAGNEIPEEALVAFEIPDQLGDVFKRLNVPKGIWGDLALRIARNFDPSKARGGDAVERYIRATVWPADPKKANYEFVDGEWKPRTRKLDPTVPLDEEIKSPDERPGHESLYEFSERERKVEALIERTAPGPDKERNARILVDYVLNEKSFKEIGDENNLTGERIRQIYIEWANVAKDDPEAIDVFEYHQEQQPKKTVREPAPIDLTDIDEIDVPDVPEDPEGGVTLASGIPPQVIKRMKQFFIASRGMDPDIDVEHDLRLNASIAEIFEGWEEVKILDKWIKKMRLSEPLIAAIDDLLVQGTAAIQADPSLPPKIKNILIGMRKRIDDLTRKIIQYGDLPPQTAATFTANLDHYIAKKYRIFKVKATLLSRGYEPSPIARQRMAAWLIWKFPQRFGTYTPDQMNAFLDEEITSAQEFKMYGRRPDKQRTKRVPTEPFLRKHLEEQVVKDFFGEINDPRWNYLNTLTQNAVMAFNARFLDYVKQNHPEYWRDNVTEAGRLGWQRHQLTDSKAWGSMRKLYVHPDLHRYLTDDLQKMQDGVKRFVLRTVTNPFKKNRTILNVPSHPRNFLTNVLLSSVAGVSIANPLNLPYYFKALRVISGKHGKHIKEYAQLIREGVTENQFFGSELTSFYNDALRLDADGWADMLERKLSSINQKYGPGRVTQFAGQMYNFEDQLFRIAAHYKNMAARGMSAEESVAEVNIALQNYRKMSHFVDLLRSYPVLGPFISFKANMVKIIGAQSARGVREMIAGAGFGKPLAGVGGFGTPRGGTRTTTTQTASGSTTTKVSNPDPKLFGKGLYRLLLLAGVLALPEIASEISKKLSNVSEEDIEQLKRYMQPFRRNGTFLYTRHKGELRAVDLTYVDPFGDVKRFLRTASETVKGNNTMGDTFDAINFFQNPVYAVWEIMLLGREPDYDQPIVNDSLMSRILTTGKYLWVPQSLPIPDLEALLGEGKIQPGRLTQPQFRRIYDAWASMDPEKQKEKMPEITAFFSGIRSWRVDPEKEITQFMYRKRAQAETLKSDYRKTAKGYRTDDQRKRDQAEAQAKMREIEAEVQEAQRFLAELKKKAKETGMDLFDDPEAPVLR